MTAITSPDGIQNPSRPFIKKFEHNGFFYIYDVNTDQIVEIKKSIYDMIDEYEDGCIRYLESKYKNIYSIYEIKRCVDEIGMAMKEYGLFSRFRPHKVSLFVKSTDEIRQLHKGPNQIIIELTRDCNLNCCYCHVSGKYIKNEAHRNNMSKDVFIKTLNFICQISDNSDNAIVSFYGGEPLLRFDFIKLAVSYLKRTGNTTKYSYNLTTNGTLLTKEIIDFFIKNDFSIKVTLDGPEKVNDRYRVFRNGKGTFQSIMRNLKFLKECNKNYYSRRVSILSILSPPFDRINETLDFFSTEKTFEELRDQGMIRAVLVNTSRSSFIEDLNLTESMKEYKKVSDIFTKRLKEAILAKNIRNLTFEKSVIYSILQRLARRPVKRLDEYTLPVGFCHIGMRRVFIRTDGGFYICERSGDDYQIGDINHGFDYEKMAGYYRKLEEVLEGCRDCWALNHCERCWVQIGNLDKFNGPKKEKFCETKKKTIEKAFKLYVELLKDNPDSLKVFK